MKVTIGTCSICGGAVTVPDLWGGVIPPTPTCSKCGAEKAGHGPVIEMQKPADQRHEEPVKRDWMTTRQSSTGSPGLGYWRKP